MNSPVAPLRRRRVLTKIGPKIWTELSSPSVTPSLHRSPATRQRTQIFGSPGALPKGLPTGTLLERPSERGSKKSQPGVTSPPQQLVAIASHRPSILKNIQPATHHRRLAIRIKSGKL